MTTTDRPTTKTKSKNAQAVQRFRDRRKAQLVTLQSENSNLRASLDHLTNQFSVLRGHLDSNSGGPKNAKGMEGTEAQVTRLQLEKYLLQRENAHLRSLTQRCLVLHRTEWGGLNEGSTIRATSPTTVHTVPCSPEPLASFRSTPPSTVSTTATYAGPKDPSPSALDSVTTLAQPTSLVPWLDPSSTALLSVVEEDPLPPGTNNDRLDSFSTPPSSTSYSPLGPGAVAPIEPLAQPSTAQPMDPNVPFSIDVCTTTTPSSANDWYAMLASLPTSWASTLFHLCLFVGRAHDPS